MTAGETPLPFQLAVRIYVSGDEQRRLDYDYANYLG
jgi:hypothetical protein